METTRSPQLPQVLVIDDSGTIRKVIEVALKRAGYEVSTYADPVEALRDLVGGQIPAPVVAIIDVGLPRMDGYDVTRLLRSNPRFQHLPILVISARDGILDRIKARLAGANAYLVKPIKMSDLLTVVQRIAPHAPQER